MTEEDEMINEGAPALVTPEIVPAPIEPATVSDIPTDNTAST